MSDIEKSTTKKKKFEVLINPQLIDHQEFKNFFSKSNSGDSELSFRIIARKYEIEVKSDISFEFNFNEISNLKKIQGILNVVQIN